jgi:hypothetical protein
MMMMIGQPLLSSLFSFMVSQAFLHLLVQSGVVVQCDSNKRVQVLRFLSIGLRNEIPIAIVMYLPELRSLDLGFGYLTGTLPTELGDVATKLEDSAGSIRRNWINIQEVNFTNNCRVGPSTIPNSYREQWTLR